MIESIRLLNFVSHKDSDIELEDGVNVFIGQNGAGKSSVVDGITYALYGEHTRDSSKNILRNKASEGSVSLTLEVGDRRYLAERKFGRAGKLESATFRELSPDPRLIVAGERRQYEESMTEEVGKTIGLDYAKMKVATIVQQGELDAIIRYKPKELKELLNALIGLDRLDVAFGNMKEAIDGFRGKLRAECMNFDDRDIEKLTAEIELQEAKRRREMEKFEELSRALADLESREKALEGEVAEMEPLRSKKQDSIARRAVLVKYVLQRLTELERRKGELEELVLKAKEYILVLESKPRVEAEGKLVEEKGRELARAREETSARLESARIAAERVDQLRREVLDGAEAIKRRADRIRRRRGDIEELELAKPPGEETVVQLQKRRREVGRMLEDLRATQNEIAVVIKNYRQIQETGVCSMCQSTVKEINLSEKLTSKHREHKEASSKVDEALKQQDEIEEMIEKRRVFDSNQKEIKSKREQVAEDEEQLESERKVQAQRKEELETKEAEAARYPALKQGWELLDSSAAELVRRKQAYDNARTYLVKTEEWLADHRISGNADVEERERELLETKRKLAGIPKDPGRAHIENLSVDEYSSGLVEEVKSLELEAARFDPGRYEEAKRCLEKEVRPEVRKCSSEMGGHRQSGEEAGRMAASLTEARAKVSEAVRYITLFEKIRSEVYNRDGILATSLRSWALKELSTTSSEYIRSFGMGISELRLKEQKHDVDLECYSSSGLVDVRSMSGGEGVAVALALRFAMARLMGRGMIDFIVLDEPTTHLDEQRKKSLVRLITSFGSEGKRSPLNQIIVITHDREIFEDSDVNAVFQFEKANDITMVAKT